MVLERRWSGGSKWHESQTGGGGADESVGEVHVDWVYVVVFGECGSVW